VLGCRGNYLYVYVRDQQGTYTKTKRLRSTETVMNILRLNADTVLCGENGGHFEVVRLSDPMVLSRMQSLELEHIFCVYEISGVNHFTTATDNGLYFFSLKEEDQFQIQMSAEVYFKGLRVTAAIEYDKDRIVASCQIND